MGTRDGRGSFRSRSRRGFTLIELLVAIILMMILLSAVTLIFVRTTETIAMSQARTAVYTNARYAMDIMEADLLGCLPFSAYVPGSTVAGQQRFILRNGTVPASGAGKFPSYDKGKGVHALMMGNGAAGDKMVFRTTTTVGDTVQTVEVSYELVPGNQTLEGGAGTLDGQPPVKPGDPNRGETVREFNGQKIPLFTLVRRVRAPDPSNPTVYNQIPLDSLKQPIPDAELCYYVMSFNIEYMGTEQQFSQLEPSPFDEDPLGDAKGKNDGEGLGAGDTAKRLPCVRVTIVIVEDIGVRQTRQIQKEIWIPVG